MNLTVTSKQQRVLDNERLRISRDIHDDLGARLTEMMLLSDQVKRDKSRADQVDAYVGRISDVAREAVRDLDAIIWAVNPKNDFLDSLGAYIFQYVEKYLGMTLIRCRLDADDELPHYPLPSEVRHNLFLVVKEAINNIVKHSGASEVWVRFKSENSALAITIEDNGKGFLAGENPRCRNGLQNMENRVRDIGGQFELMSQIGQGTQIKIQLNLKKSRQWKVIGPPKPTKRCHADFPKTEIVS